MRMRAGRITAHRVVEVVDAPMPTLREGEVLVRLRALSLCGTDLHKFSRLLPARAYPLPVGKPTHECAGVVEESRSPDFRPGQRVIALPTGSAGLVEYVAEPPANLIPLPDDGDLASWVLCQHVGCVLVALARIGSVVGKRVVVLGQGSIGLAFTRLLSRASARQIIAVDVVASRLQVASASGATSIVDASREDVAERVATLTEGVGADVTIEATGEPDCQALAVAVTRPLGLVDFFGSSDDEHLRFPFEIAFTKNLTCIFTVSARLAGARQVGVREAVTLMAQGRLDLAPLITHRFTLDEVQKAYDVVADRADGVLKAIITL